MKQNKTTEMKIASWANIMRGLAIILISLSIFVGIVLLGINAEDLWWITLSIIIGGCILSLPVFMSADLVTGFAEIVANTKKIANGNAGEATENEALPEL